MLLGLLTITTFLHPVIKMFWNFVTEIISSYLWISYTFIEPPNELLNILVKKFKAYKISSSNNTLNFISGWCFHDKIPFHVSYRMEKYDKILTIGTSRIFEVYLQQFINLTRKNKNTKHQKVCINGYNSWIKIGTTYRCMNSLFINDDLKEDLLNDVEKFLSAKENYKKFGIKWKRTYLFWGKPGTGKTSTISALATKFSLPLYYLDLSLFTEQRQLCHCLSEINETSLIIVEDLKSVIEKKKKDDQNVDMQMILNFFDGLLTPEHIIIITSNNPNEIDSTILRSGRIDRKYEFKYPTKEKIKEILDFYKNDRPVQEFINKSQAEIINEIYK